MPGYYIYLISSLPMLHFGMRPPISFERFLETCKGLVSENDSEKIGTAPIFTIKIGAVPIFAFDTNLRNALVRIRAARKRIDPDKYLRGDGCEEPSIATIAMNAYKNPSILESEEMLDRERWRALDELEAGHYFDLDFLIVYALKLLMLERWERVRTADAGLLLEETI